MTGRYSLHIITLVLTGFVVGLVFREPIAKAVAPLRVDAVQSGLQECQKNPLESEYNKLEKQYGVDLSFTDCAFFLHGKGLVSNFPIFREAKKSLDILVVGDSSIAWGLSPEAVAQISGLKVGMFAYEGQFLNVSNIPIYEAVADCVLKDSGRVLLAFTPTNQSQPGHVSTSAIMQGYQADLAHMKKTIKEGSFCEKYFTERMSGTVGRIISQGKVIGVMAEDGVLYHNLEREGLVDEPLEIGDRVTFRPMLFQGKRFATDFKLEKPKEEFSSEIAKVKVYIEKNNYGILTNEQGENFVVNNETLIEKDLQLSEGTEVELVYYPFNNQNISYQVYSVGKDGVYDKPTLQSKVLRFFGEMLGFNSWHAKLDRARKILSDSWNMSLPETDLYGYRIEHLVNEKWHTLKNQFDSETQKKIQWGDDTITIYGSSFKETAPNLNLEPYYPHENYRLLKQANTDAVLDWAKRRELIYTLPLSVIPKGNIPEARAIYYYNYKDQLGLIDMHAHFIENGIKPILMQFGHHPANQGGMIQSLELGKVLVDFKQKWQRGEKLPVNVELKPLN